MTNEKDRIFVLDSKHLSTGMAHIIMRAVEMRDSGCLKTVRIGNYDKSVMRYVRSELRHSHKIQKRRIFITHAGCTVKMVSEVQAEVERLGSFDEVLITKASATVSSNCGMGTIGVLFVREER